MKLIAKEAVLLLTFLLLGAIYAAPRAKAEPGPIEVSWQVFGGDPLAPINGASVEIYYATSNPGAFAKVPEAAVLDVVASPNVNRNPIFTGDFASYSGMAIAHIDEAQLPGIPSSLLYYAIIVLPDSTMWIWPVATTTNRNNPEWSPVPDPDSPSGWAAPHSGVGCGPTTAYLIPPPPPPVIPEVPFGTIAGFLSMFTVLLGFVGVGRFRPKPH